MSRNQRNFKLGKVNRGVLEEQQAREENKVQNLRALLYILPLIMLAVLAVGIFFGYKFYVNTLNEKSPISPSEYIEDDTHSSNPMFLITVSAASPIDKDFVPETVECCGIQIAPEAADGLNSMVADAKKAGFDLMVVEGYVSYDDQAKRYKEEVEKYRKDSKASLIMAEAHVKKELPPAGESEQQTGLLVYLTVKTDGKFADTPAYSWLTRHCVDYGFILRYPNKENAGGISYSSHLFRYVGKTYAHNMRALDMNFDRFTEYLAAH